MDQLLQMVIFHLPGKKQQVEGSGEEKGSDFMPMLVCRFQQTVMRCAGPKNRSRIRKGRDAHPGKHCHDFKKFAHGIFAK